MRQRKTKTVAVKMPSPPSPEFMNRVKQYLGFMEARVRFKVFECPTMFGCKMWFGTKLLHRFVTVVTPTQRLAVINHFREQGFYVEWEFEDGVDPWDNDASNPYM